MDLQVYFKRTPENLGDLLKKERFEPSLRSYGTFYTNYATTDYPIEINYSTDVDEEIREEMAALAGTSIAAGALISTSSFADDEHTGRWRRLAWRIADQYDAILIDPQSGETLRK